MLPPLLLLQFTYAAAAIRTLRYSVVGEGFGVSTRRGVRRCVGLKRRRDVLLLKRCCTGVTVVSVV